MKKLFILSLLMLVTLTACVPTEQNYAPVVDAEEIEAIPQSGIYKVLPGETLYSIAWRYGLDYKSLAARNRLSSPFHVRSGQILYLKGRMPRKIVHQSLSPKPKSTVLLDREPTAYINHWSWPADGKVIGSFSEYNRGVNIAGHHGDPIFASAPGKVVYAGSGLRGYGNLIIIKHNDTYLTAYAHNSINLVKSGQWVRGRQKIAEMGETSRRLTMLHFEIRRDGKPMNPLKVL